MTTVAQPVLVSESRARPWETGVVEFLLVGGATPLFFLSSWFLRHTVGLDSADLAVGFLFFYGAHFINDPHFAVTYLLFYEKARARAFGGEFAPLQRARYIVAGIVIPAGLVGWAATALAVRSAYSLGLLIQLMFLLVGWHYVKQGFGVMTVLAARRGVRLLPRERLAVLAHCYAGWAYAWASPYDPGKEVEEKGIVYTTIAHPHGLEHVTHAIFLATAVVLVGVLGTKWRREGRLPIFTPLTALLCSIWAWSIYSSIDPLVVYAIPALHSIQYLYFVWLLKGNEAREREGPPWFERSASVRIGLLALSALVLGWVLFHGAPAALDDSLVPRRSRFTAMGQTPYFAALFAIVNIHHFFMDYVIWRRENRKMRYLTLLGTLALIAIPGRAIAGVPPKAPVVVAAVGDSLTDVRSHGGKFLDVLRERCPKSRFDNYGKGGEMVNQMRRRFESELFAAGKPAYTHVIIFGGVNDLYSDVTAGRTPSLIEHDLTLMYQEAGRHGARIVALTVAPWGGFAHFNVSRSAATLEVNGWILAQRDAGAIEAAVDTYSLLSCGNPTMLCSRYTMPFRDGLHFGDEGHQRLGEALFDQVFANCE
jgi:lysophospholipase L1-like esterase